MRNISSKRNNSFTDFLFFTGLIIILISLLIGMVTLKNECAFLQNEIYHLESIKTSHANKLKVLKSNVINLSRQDRIEKLASEAFNLEVPSPESLIVYIETIR